MSDRALLLTAPLQGCPPPHYAAPDPMIQGSVAHDLRNLLATIGLHLETLQRLSGPSGAKAADAAHELLARNATLCNSALKHACPEGAQARRRGVDLVQIARQVVHLVRPCAPEGFCFEIGRGSAGNGLADPDDVFRILFNLMANAVEVANRKPTALTTITTEVGTKGANVTIRVSDDGPGLPARVRTGLFMRDSRGTKSYCHGHGLVIARELAERNGGTLTLIPSAKGASFALTLPGEPSPLSQDRSIGRRAMSP